MSPSRIAGRLHPYRLRDVAAAAGALLAGLAGTLRRRRRRADHLTLATGGRGDGPPDLDELWRDFNRKLTGLFGNKPAPQRPGPSGDGGGNGGGGGSNFQPDMRSAGIGVALVAGVVALIWLGSGFFIVQEGQQAVVTSFGKYSHTADAGFQWRMPYPFQAHETVNVTQLRSTEVGRNVVVPATGLRDSSMLTQDENIVDIRFTVQYRLKDARAFLFENRDPEEAVKLAAESAVREIVGQSRIDSVFYEQRDAIASELVKSVQVQLDRLKAGIVIVNVNVQSVQAPEQVQAAFEDTLKAGQDGDRLKKEGLAYASDVIPKAQGTAARLREEAEAHKARVIAQAQGRCAAFHPGPDRVPEGTRRDPRPAVHRDHAAGLQQRDQGDGGEPRQLEPVVPAVGQVDAAVWRGGRRLAGPGAGAGRIQRQPGERRIAFARRATFA